MHNDSNEDFSTPLNINDLLEICKEFNKLGWQIQSQMEHLLELGIEDAIKSGFVKYQSLPHIKQFLKSINNNPLFGDASQIAADLVIEISCYEQQNNKINQINLN